MKNWFKDINWFVFFKKFGSSWGLVAGFITVSPVIYAVGYYSNFFEKDKVIKELQEKNIDLSTKINNISNTSEKQEVIFEREKLKYERMISNLQDSLKNATK